MQVAVKVWVPEASGAPKLNEALPLGPVVQSIVPGTAPAEQPLSVPLFLFTMLSPWSCPPLLASTSTLIFTTAPSLGCWVCALTTSTYGDADAPGSTSG